MTAEEKLTRLRVLFPDQEEIPEDSVLSEYLDIAGSEILNWLYIRVGTVPEDAEVPAIYENTQIMAVLAAVNIIGAEGESLHIENGTHRQFKYEDLLAYVRTHVYPQVVVG